jgi:D-alanyl-D-alanine carboxypeptidase/D-alanyl-D-alanine-endopeptidase (penicillin-binding protein 4)
MQILILPLLVFFFSCSVTKQISKSAKQNVLNDDALQTAHVGISIYEPATGKYWYNYQGDKYFVPASNTKLATCYAAMKYLGDSLVGLRYKEWNNALYVQSTGDPTFLYSEFRSQPVYHFLKSPGKNIYWNTSNWKENILGNGWAWNDYIETYMAGRSYQPIYGNIVTFTGNSSGFFSSSPQYFERKVASWSPNAYGGNIDLYRKFEQNNISISEGNSKSKTITFYPDAETIFNLLRDTIKQQILEWENPIEYNNIVHSQPTDSLLKPMMHRSDNFFAEQSLLMVSNELLGVMNDEKIIDTLLKTDFKNLPQKPRWVDGSGLSRYNLFTSQDFVFILSKMKTDFGMERIKIILPTGNEGTLEGRFVRDSNYIFAKTGTLSGVVSLSGFLYTKKNKLLIFSVLVNNHNSSAGEIRRAVEKFIQEIRDKY